MRMVAGATPTAAAAISARRPSSGHRCPKRPAGCRRSAPVLDRAEAWLRAAAGGVTPDALRSAILRRYGKDQTFSVPILTVLALTGKLGNEVEAAWRSIPQLPFELAALPHAWFQHLKLPVVSYALPALIAIGQVRHSFAPSRNPVARLLRDRVRDRTHRVLREMQPESGGYLEATPLTSFVTMSLAGMGWIESPVVEHGVRFLVDSMRADGSWPIDTNLSTWVTTLSIGALAEAGELPQADVSGMRHWLLDQQSRREHPFTHAAPGAWAWTPLSGGVPDADDTCGALLALRRLGQPDAATTAAAAAGARWLLGVQNRDGGIPTFCRGWGTLPFDRSTPEITAHTLLAWSAWYPAFDTELQAVVRTASVRALAFLRTTQRADGSWIPLWFGNEHAPDEDNPVYGTARVLTGLHSSLADGQPGLDDCRQRALNYLLERSEPRRRLGWCVRNALDHRRDGHRVAGDRSSRRRSGSWRQAQRCGRTRRRLADHGDRSRFPRRANRTLLRAPLVLRGPLPVDLRPFGPRQRCCAEPQGRRKQGVRSCFLHVCPLRRKVDIRARNKI